jgi:hypothetical protein
MALRGTAFVGRRLGRRRSSSSRDGVPIPRRHSGAPRPPVPLAPGPPSCTGRSPPPHNARRGGAENTAASPSRRQSARRELPTPASPPTLAASRVRVAPRCRPLIAPALSATVHYRATPRGRRWVSALPASTAHGQCCQRIRQLTTPVDNSLGDDPEVVTVHDPTHPLYGQRFLIAARPSRPDAQGTHLLVFLRDTVQLRLPLRVTLPVSTEQTRSKLTPNAVAERIATAPACGLWQSDRQPCGACSPTTSNRPSCLISQPSSAR